MSKISKQSQNSPPLHMKKQKEKAFQNQRKKKTSCTQPTKYASQKEYSKSEQQDCLQRSQEAHG